MILFANNGLGLTDGTALALDLHESFTSAEHEQYSPCTACFVLASGVATDVIMVTVVAGADRDRSDRPAGRRWALAGTGRIRSSSMGASQCAAHQPSLFVAAARVMAADAAGRQHTY